MTAAWRWRLAIGGLLGGNIVAMIVLATVANVGSSQVIPDYYAKAANYDHTLEEEAVSDRLGWHVDATLEAGLATVSIRDRADAPVEAARVTLAGYPRAHAGERVEIELVAAGAGHYTGTVDRLPGIHDWKITIGHAGARYVHSVVVDAR